MRTGAFPRFHNVGGGSRHPRPHLATTSRGEWRGSVGALRAHLFMSLRSSIFFQTVPSSEETERLFSDPLLLPSLTTIPPDIGDAGPAMVLR